MCRSASLKAKKTKRPIAAGLSFIPTGVSAPELLAGRVPGRTVGGWFVDIGRPRRNLTSLPIMPNRRSRRLRFNNDARRSKLSKLANTQSQNPHRDLVPSPKTASVRRSRTARWSQPRRRLAWLASTSRRCRGWRTRGSSGLCARGVCAVTPNMICAPIWSPALTRPRTGRKAARPVRRDGSARSHSLSAPPVTAEAAP